MRWRRNRKKVKGLKFSFSKAILLIILLLFLSAVFVIGPRLLNIRYFEAQIEKADCASENQIRNTAKLLGQNFFLINSTKVESELKKSFICIKSVKIQKQFPDKIKLKVSGREPAAVLVVAKESEASSSGLLEKFTEVQATPSGEATSSAIFTSNGENLVVDSEGVIYSNNADGINATKIYISGLNLTLGQRKNEDLIKNTLKILENVKNFGVSISDVKIYSEKLLLVNAVPRIIFKLDKKIETQIASLQLILNKAKIDDRSLEFIDLRFDKPIVRFAPKNN